MSANETFTVVPKSKWSKLVRDSASNTCAYCGAICGNDRKTQIEAHHILPKSLYPDLINVLENGIALCHTCHYSLHGGKYINGNKKYMINCEHVDFDDIKGFVKSRSDNLKRKVLERDKAGE